MYGIIMIRKAIDFATIKHTGQKRKGSGLDYITHPIKVGFILQSLNMPYAVIIAGILHDTIEDTDATYDEIVREFGIEVADLVMELTKTDKDKCQLMGKNNYLIEKMSLKLSKNALCAKLGDRLDNVSDQPAEKYIYDTIRMIKEIKEKRPIISIEARELMDKISTVLEKQIKKIEEGK